MHLVDGLPILKTWQEDLWSDPVLSTFGNIGYVRTPSFLCRLDLASGNLEWLVERSWTRYSEAAKRLPRRIRIGVEDATFWISTDGLQIAEIASIEDGGLKISARNATTGNLIWEKQVSAPKATDWAEPDPVPSTPGDQQDETWAFLVDSPAHLILCLIRATTRTICVAPGMTMSALPQTANQTSGSSLVPRFRPEIVAVRLNSFTGAEVWRQRYLDVIVDYSRRRCFDGVWFNGSQIGAIDLDTGTNTTLFRSTERLGQPVRDGSTLAFSWHSDRHVGVEWIDFKNGCRKRSAIWSLSGVRSTLLRATDSGLGLQTNDQYFWWLGNADAPLWKTRAKPYIYHVYRSLGTDVFIGTAGNGGRLLALDANSGAETLNIKPTAGGFGSLVKVPGHEYLVSPFRVSRSWSAQGRLFVLSMKNRIHDFDQACSGFVGPWEHGAIIRVGKKGERLAVIDIRSSDIARQPKESS